MPTPTSTQPAQRLEALSHQLDHPIPERGMMSTDKRPPITCHILDTSLGRPAANIPVLLTLHSAAPDLSFRSTTNGDGRVTAWSPSSPSSSQSQPPSSSPSLEEVFQRKEDQRWSLLFDTESYFGARGIETFFPEVQVRFLVRGGQKEEHFHVPVLLGPFGWSTYRGS
ncbi:Hydroxyisourate hydrolase [Lojkania enalia]|uniref:hydroxyisourate hydrolase n=1 Tax=Lojkania enalia TaxID=147567 RepID=A0A9P4N0V7_9PLEO|nr:Hydroxyisourate hydrolase [Didymosphaeria enalia]